MIHHVTTNQSKKVISWIFLNHIELILNKTYVSKREFHTYTLRLCYSKIFIIYKKNE